MAEDHLGRGPIPHMTKSFMRLEHTPSYSLPRTESSASTQRLSPQRKVVGTKAMPLGQISPPVDDVFDRSSAFDDEDQDMTGANLQEGPLYGFEDLPVELVSLIDRFIESLSAKIHDTPPSIDKLTDIFQHFYTLAKSSIDTHISALSTHQTSSKTPEASVDLLLDGKRFRSSLSRDTVGPVERTAPEQQMLTPQEIQDQKNARRLLGKRALALEEAVERKVCQQVYDRIWRHRSTMDEMRDEKLRSRIAALALVGIGSRDLGIDLETRPPNNEDISVAVAVGDEIERQMAQVREHLECMNDAKFPLGKLQQLAAAHKTIVDLLTAFHHASSSADEILPVLIYTLIGTPPEGINVISNLNFIQRFRAASKVDGEAAYCLTNLEAAVTFIETVDLATLRSDELFEGPLSTRPQTPSRRSGEQTRVHSPEPLPNPSSLPGPSDQGPLSCASSESLNPGLDTLPSLSHQRHLSNFLQPPKDVLGAAGDTVRNSAEHGLKTMGITLDNSFKFLFGRLREQVVLGSEDRAGKVIVPKTLDDAAKLVGTKPDEGEDLKHVSQKIHTAAQRLDRELSRTAVSSDDPRSFFSFETTHDKSVDSLQGIEVIQKPNMSSGSDRSGMTIPSSLSDVKDRAPYMVSENTRSATVESMRHFGNSLNPLKGLGGINVMRGFGRSSISGSVAAAVDGEKPDQPLQMQNFSSASPDKIASPVTRFVNMPKADELRIADIPELLKDYQRLANALTRMGAFELGPSKDEDFAMPNGAEVRAHMNCPKCAGHPKSRGIISSSKASAEASRTV